MSEKIQSRRAFFTNAAKVVGAVALAAPLFVSAQAEAKPDENNPPTFCQVGCGAGCFGGCSGNCNNTCTRFNANAG